MLTLVIAVLGNNPDYPTLIVNILSGLTLGLYFLGLTAIAQDGINKNERALLLKEIKEMINDSKK